MSTILLAVSAFAFPPAATLMLRRVFGRSLSGPRFYIGWLRGAAGGLVASLIEHAWLCAISLAASGLLALILWWWSRRKRRKGALKALGEKSRQLVLGLTRQLRERARGMPQLRPLPGGVS